MMRILVLALGFYAAGALRIQAKKKTDALPQNSDTAKSLSFSRIKEMVPKNGATANSVTFSKVKVQIPIYDLSDEPFQSVDFAGRIHEGGRGGGAEVGLQDSEEDGDKPGAASGGQGMNRKDKAKIIRSAMQECTPENSTKLANANPVQNIPQGDFWKSALPAGSFYRKVADQHKDGTMGCAGENCQLPTYLAARKSAATSQKIPRIIWMTMNDKLLAGATGPFQYSLVSAHFNENPEYEFIVSGDKMTDAFMQSGEVKEAWQNAYAKARNGAEKADIWRYAVLYKYGGVYMDSDMTLFAPYKTFISKDATIVQQMTAKGDLKAHRYETSQYGLFMAPGNKLLETLLDDISAAFASGTGLPLTIVLTGPGALAHVYKKLGVCGITSCGSEHANKVCGITVDSCSHGQIGKVDLLVKKRDFNTGEVWHKADVCALAESRSKVTHWAGQGKEKGGTGKKGVGF